MILGAFERYLQGVPFYRVGLTENRLRPVYGPISLFPKSPKTATGGPVLIGRGPVRFRSFCGP